MRPRRPLDLRLAGLQWLVAWAVVLDAVLARFAPDLPAWAFGGTWALFGIILRTNPFRMSVWREGGVGGVCLVILGSALRYLRGAAGVTDGSLWAPAWIVLAVVLLLDVSAWPRLARLVRVEWTKAWRSLLFRLGLLAAVLVTLLAGLLHEDLPNQSGWTVAAGSLGSGGWVAEVFVLVMGAVALAGEATGGTMKMMLPHAYRRSDWIFAKAIVLLVVALCFLVVVGAVALGHAAVDKGLGDVTRTLEPVFGEEEGAVETFQTGAVMQAHFRDALLSLLAALGATALLGLFLSSMFDHVVAALCVAFLLFAGLKFADVVLSLPRETMEAIYAWYPGEIRDLTSKLGRALNERWDAALLPAGLVLALLTGAVATLLGIRIFSRRDLQV